MVWGVVPKRSKLSQSLCVLWVSLNASVTSLIRVHVIPRLVLELIVICVVLLSSALAIQSASRLVPCVLNLSILIGVIVASSFSSKLIIIFSFDFFIGGLGLSHLLFSSLWSYLKFIVVCSFPDTSRLYSISKWLLWHAIRVIWRLLKVVIVLIELQISVLFLSFNHCSSLAYPQFGKLHFFVLQKERRDAPLISLIIILTLLANLLILITCEESVNKSSEQWEFLLSFSKVIEQVLMLPFIFLFKVFDLLKSSSVPIS